MAIITTNETIDYNVVSTDRASANMTIAKPSADADFHNNANHITDDLAGAQGHNGTTVRGGNTPNVLEGETLQPDRYILTDAGEDLDVKRISRVSDNNPHVIVMDEVNTDYAEGFGDDIFNSFLNEDAYEYTITSTSISGLRTALVQAGDTRWTSDKKLGRKDINKKYQYIETFDDNGTTKFRLKLSNCVGHAALKTMVTPAMSSSIAPYKMVNNTDVM